MSAPKKRMPRWLKYTIIVVLLVSLVLGSWAATQFFASRLHYQELLGSPWGHFGKAAVYAPWSFWIWYIKFSGDAPRVFAQGFSMVGMFFGMGVVAVAVLKRKMMPEPLTSAGSAHWADREDIKDAKLLDGKGIFLGKTEDGFYLRDNDNRHALVVSPTRGGKGTGLIVPTGLYWKESVVFLDIKGEIYSITAGYRRDELHQTVIKFDPSSPEGSARFNPLDEVRLGTEHEVKDMGNIVHAIARPDGGDSPDHWRDLAGSIIEGVAMHLAYVQQGAVSFSDVLNFIFGAIPIRQRLFEMAETVHAVTDEQKEFFERQYRVTDGIHPFVKQKAYSFLQKDEREFAGIISTVEETLKDFADPVLAKNTSLSSFHISDLMNRDKPVSLYLICPPSDLSRLGKFFRLIVVLIYQRLTETMEFRDGRPVKNYKHELLLLLDEFPALGKILEFEKALGYIAGYGLRAFLIVQGLDQLFAPHMYGKNTSIIENCHIRVFHTPNDAETPKFMSAMLGKQTIKVKMESYQNDLTQLFGASNYNMQEKARDLKTAAEISEMDAEDEIIFVSGKPPICCKKIRYFKDKNFVSRLRQEPPTDELYCIEDLEKAKQELIEQHELADAEIVAHMKEIREVERQVEEMQREKKFEKDKAALAAYREELASSVAAAVDDVGNMIEVEAGNGQRLEVERPGAPEEPGTPEQAAAPEAQGAGAAFAAAKAAMLAKSESATVVAAGGAVAAVSAASEAAAEAANEAETSDESDEDATDAEDDLLAATMADPYANSHKSDDDYEDLMSQDGDSDNGYGIEF